MGDAGAPRIAVVGMGVDRQPPASALSDLANADLVVGSRRHLDVLEGLTTAVLLEYPQPFSTLWDLLNRHVNQRIVLLASGDPLLYGVGASLLQHQSAEGLVFHPNVSSVQAALARARLPCHDASVVSLHGRPMETLRSRLRANRVYVCLTDPKNTPHTIATELMQAGFEDSDIWVAEELGSETERLTRFKAHTPPEQSFSALNVVVLQTRGSRGMLPEFPGIPDQQFSTDGDTPGAGMISKREVRLMALSMLAPRAGDIAWDIGAGCGGISVEWARWNRRGQVFAVELNEDRVRHLQTNRKRFGVTNNLEIVHQRAPEALTNLPDPNAVYLGGSDGNLGELIEICWQRLQRRGRLVAAAVTEESRAALRTFAGSNDVHWTQLAIARDATLGGQHIMRPQLPVLLLQRCKS